MTTQPPNPNTQPNAEVVTSNYQPILSKNAPLKPLNVYRSTNNNPSSYLSFGERVEQSPYLVSFENQNVKTKKKPKKKVIQSYVANTDTLFIPRPERVHQGIDIFKNLIEEEKKIVTADLGIQSDEIEYDKEEEEKKHQFLPQKLGKDESTQIMDGDLFNFDIDVIPLLTVIVGKTIEQALLELEQEEEIANLREAKKMFAHHKNDDNKRIKNLEEREIQKKYNNDAKKEQRKAFREKRKTTQKQLISRVISKTYLRDIYKNAVSDLVYRGQFRNYTSAIVKNTTNNILMTGTEKLNNIFHNMNNFIKSVLDNKYKTFENNHQNSVEERHIFLAKIAEQEERKRKEEEQRKIQEELDRKERRRKRKVERIKKEIKEAIIDAGVQKSDAYSEEITEIGNNGNNEEPYIGVYGGFLGLLVMTLNLVERDCFQEEVLFNVENIGEILKMVFDEASCTLVIHFNEEAKEKIEEILKGENKKNDDEEEGEKKEEQLTDLKNLSDLSSETWNKIGDVLENVEYNNDIYLKNYLEEFSNSLTDKEGNEIAPAIKDDYIYKTVIRTLIDLCSKASYSDHYKLLFDTEPANEKDEKEENEEEEKKDDEENKPKEKTFEDVLKEYEAICMLEWKKSTEEIIENCEYLRPGRKKNVPAPDLDNDFIQVKAYQNNQNVAENLKPHNVLLYDRIAEFCIRNKIFECALAHLSFVTSIENESSGQFKAFNKCYDECIDNSKINNTIQVYHYAPEEEKPENEEGEEQEES